MRAASPNRVRVGAFEFDLLAGELRDAVCTHRLQEQPFQILLMLVDAAGGVVTSQAIREKLWPSDTVVEYDHSIHTAIKKLRHAFGDSAESPSYIETVARRGYRLMVPVEPLNGPATKTSPGPDAASTVKPLPAPAHAAASVTATRASLLRASLYGFLLVSSLAIVAVLWLSKLHSTTPHHTLSLRQLTHNAPENRPLGSAISPDGTHLLFADTKGLHLSAIDTGEVRDITLPSEIQTKLWDVAWFPDGEQILVTAQGTQGDGLTIWATSIFADPPRQLRSHARSATVSPDGTSIAFLGGDNHEIWRMDSNGENSKKIFSSNQDRSVALTWSPSGTRLAFIKPDSAENLIGGTIETIAVSQSAPSKDQPSPLAVLSDPDLVSSGSVGNRLLWLRDGRLIFSKSESLKVAEANLWSIVTDPQTGKPSGQPTKITNWSGITPVLLSASKDNTRIAVTLSHDLDDIYIAELKQNGTVLDSPRRFTVSDSENYPDTWTRDSKALLFESNRMGRIQIFRQELDKDTPEHFIDGARNDNRSAALTSDGASILYWSTSRSNSPAPAVMRLNRSPISGGTAQQVLEIAVAESPNFDCPLDTGASCVLARIEQGRLTFYSLDPFHGAGKELATAYVGAYEADWSLSPDGDRVALATQQNDALRLINLRDKTETNLPIPGNIWSLAWAADGSGIFITDSQSANYRLTRVDLNGKTHLLLDRGRNQWLGFLRPSPDGRSLAFTQQTFQMNVWLLENF
jgi:eukaryotic-like serine/threonine-protein kinase